jgi:two-component system sensor histidine kinase HydH
MLVDKDFQVYYSKGDKAIPINSSATDFTGVPEAFNTSKPTIHHVFEDSIAQVIFTHPFSNSEGFQGLAITVFELEDLIKIHGNIETEDEQFLFVIDKNYDIIVDPVLVGNNLFGDSVVSYIGMEEKEASHYENVLREEKFYTSVYSNNLGERIDTGIPIRVNGEIEYFLFVITPTAPMKNMIAKLVSTDQIQTVVLLMITGFFVIGFSLKQRKKIRVDKLTMIGQLSSNIAHDIRNPLGAIRNSSVIIEKENKDENEKITRELKRIKISTKRISHQVEEVLNYVRTTPLNLKEISILKTIQESVESTEIPENVTIRLPQNDVTIAHDKEKILIVFVNVILNAIQAIEEKQGYLAISIDENRSDVTIHFENSGPAILDNVLPKLFEPLFTTRLKGTGLGLSSCKNIIEQHNGSISVSQLPVRFSIKISKNLK